MKSVLLLACLASPLQAKLKVVEEVDISVGDPIEVSIEARHNEMGVALLPKTLDLPQVLLERPKTRRHERTRTEEGVVDRYQLQLIAFEPGLIEIPPLSLVVGSTTAQTAPVILEVESNLSEEEQQTTSSTAAETLSVLEQLAAENPPPAVVRVFDPRPILALIFALFLPLAFYAVVRYLRKPSPPKPAPPPRPAHEVAWEALEALNESQIDTPDSLNLYYTALSSIVRRYLGDRFGIDALERTPQELLDLIHQKKLNAIDHRRLSQLLFEAEQAKFAKFAPSMEAAKDAMQIAKTLVKDTRPTEAAA